MKLLIFNLLLLYAYSGLPVFGQTDTINGKLLKDDTGKSLDLFDSENLLEVSLTFDLTRYLKKDFKEALEGVLTIHINEKDSLIKNVKIKNRGKYRSSYCFYPPLEVNFKKPKRAYPGFGTINKVKLVTRCESGNLYDEYVLKEYLVYKLFNVLTDTSFRVRLVRLNFIDSRKNKKPIRQYGFFIEPKELLAERTNSTIVRRTNLNQKHITQEVMDRVAIFNYMVGNFDWSVESQHNIIVMLPLKDNPSGLGLAVPFDFDATGVVDAEYAVPPPDLAIKTVRDRIFLGIARDKSVYQNDLLKFLNRKPELYRVIEEFPYLKQRAKKDITNFLDEFFIQIEKQRTRDQLIESFNKKARP